MSAVTTPFGLFEFVIMPFGLWNAIQIFQRLMNQVLQGLKCCFAYVDDVLTASTDEERHKKDLCQIFQRLQKAGITINPVHIRAEEHTIFRTRDQQRRYQRTNKVVKAITNFT